MRERWLTVFASALVMLALVAGCGGGGGSATSPIGSGPGHPNPSPTPTAGPIPSPSVTPDSKIQHVVIVIQENRSFDNLFQGYPGADTASEGLNHLGQEVPLEPENLDKGPDLSHRHYTAWASYDGGRMDGFDIDIPPGQNWTYPYHYVPQTDVQPYWTMAQQYVIADRMFQSNTAGSYPAHLYLVAAQSGLVAGNPNNLPWGCDAPSNTTVGVIAPDGQTAQGPFPCFTWPTIADEADARGVIWRFYSPSVPDSGGIWSTYDSFSSIRLGPDWARDVVTPETTILSDIAGGGLAQITWVVPNGTNSDHPGSYSATGPSWVASIVNAIGQSPFWDNTAIFVTWDDWGGWYDHVPPPQLDQMGLNFRVPLLVISPYAKHGYVSHVQHEFGSILKFTEENFGLPSLGQSDARADDLSDCFDFTQTPAPFQPIAALKPRSYFATFHGPETAPDSD